MKLDMNNSRNGSQYTNPWQLNLRFKFKFGEILIMGEIKQETEKFLELNETGSIIRQNL